MKDIEIANYIFALIKYELVSETDLEFAYDVFLTTEEYEKCSILKELIDVEHFEKKTSKCHYENITRITNLIDGFGNDPCPELVKYRDKLVNKLEEMKKYTTEIINIQATPIVPPIKNEKNLQYFKI